MEQENIKTIYEYRISNDGTEIVKSVYNGKILKRDNGSYYYLIFRGKYRERKFVHDEDFGIVERNMVFSLDDDFDKYSQLIMKTYKEKNDILERQLNDRKELFSKLEKKYGYKD